MDESNVLVPISDQRELTNSPVDQIAVDLSAVDLFAVDLSAVDQIAVDQFAVHQLFTILRVIIY